MIKHLQDISRLKKLQPILERCGVKPSITLHYYKEQVCGIPKGTIKIKDHEVKTLAIEEIGSFDHADLESVLPDWVFDRSLTASRFEPIIGYPKNSVYFHHVSKLRDDVNYSRGQAKLEAMADLIILLWENGIKLKGQEDE